MLKPWKFMTTNLRIVEAFQHMRCNHHPSEHDPCEGADTTRSGFYPPRLAYMIAQAMFPSKFANPAPPMPCIPSSETSQQHREHEQDLKHISALAGIPQDELFAVALESDAEAHAMVSELVESLLATAFGVPKNNIKDPEVQAMVTKLLSRTEMLNDPAALAAVRAEADGLRAAHAWDETSVREHADVKAEAKSSGVSVHFGQLMTIASIKFYQLAQHLQKKKGRIVYRGDCAKDENGVAAVYQELGANPTRFKCMFSLWLHTWSQRHGRRCHQDIHPGQTGVVP